VQLIHELDCVAVGTYLGLVYCTSFTISLCYFLKVKNRLLRSPCCLCVFHLNLTFTEPGMNIIPLAFTLTQYIFFLFLLFYLSVLAIGNSNMTVTNLQGGREYYYLLTPWSRVLL